MSATTRTTCAGSCARRAEHAALAAVQHQGNRRRVTACDHAAPPVNSGERADSDVRDMEDGVLLLDEASARQLVLARAVEDVDAQGRILSAVEREQIEREALEASRGGGTGGIDFAQYLLQRARRMLAIVDQRQPRIAALQDPEGWRRWLLVALPLAACVLGTAIDRIDNPHQVNMLSPPLLGVLAWNLAVYVAMLLSLFLPQPPHLPLAGLRRWWAGLPA